MLFDAPQAFGLVLDISDRKDRDGKRLSSKVRNQLVKFTNYLTGDDSLYLCQMSQQPATTDGERTALVANWESEEDNLDLGYLLEYTLASLAQEDYDMPRTLCLVTDRLNQLGKNAVTNLNILRKKGGLECRFLVVGIGNRYNRGDIAAFCNVEKIDFRHTTDVEFLCNIMQKWFEENLDGE